MQMSKINIGSIKDLIPAEIGHDFLELPKKSRGLSPPEPPSSTALSGTALDLGLKVWPGSV